MHAGIDYAAPRETGPEGGRDHGWAADLCAAPGGKALALAALGWRVLAADRSSARLRLLGRPDAPHDREVPVT